MVGVPNCASKGNKSLYIEQGQRGDTRMFVSKCSISLHIALGLGLGLGLNLDLVSVQDTLLSTLTDTVSINMRASICRSHVFCSSE